MTAATKPLTFCEQAILDCLEEYGDSTPRQIVRRAGVAYKTLYGQKNYLAALADRGLVHIAEWRRQKGHGGPPQPVYTCGAGKDAPKPAPLSDAEASRQYRQRQYTRRSTISAVLGTRSARAGTSRKEVAHAGA